jgi:hypothetical protein
MLPRCGREPFREAEEVANMSMRIVAASAIAALHLAAAPAAPAADLAGDPYGDDYYAESYYDSREKDVVREEEVYKHRRYSERHSYADHEPLPPPRQVWDGARYGGRACIPRGEIRHALRAHGWYDFHDVELRGEIAVLRARRDSGRFFDLHVDRCSGEVVSARPLERRAYAPFAPGPRRYWRTY